MSNGAVAVDRKSTRLNSSHLVISYAVFCLKKNKDFRADFHACGLRVLPTHLYQLFSFYQLHGATRAPVARRLGVAERRAFFFFNDTATTEIYTLSLHDALPI